MALAVLSALVFLFACNKEESQISYNQHIRPILNENCLVCHGGVKKMGGFSLLFREEALDTTESGVYAIIPGNHKKSELYKRLVHHDPEIRMPQEAEPLPQREIDLIARWIDEGAAWEEHWAYAPAQKPEVPDLSSAWIKNDIDPFILEKLNELGLKPEEEADRHTLARRLSLDLLGLPPEPEWVDAFLADDSPEAYEKYVDRLLASPHFGERWAAMWLDLARYADSKGYEKDPYRSIWKYRDWVIDAFNQDMPFDQFTIEQLAGDQLPEPDAGQLIATAFHRNTMTNTEGGTDDEEFRLVSVMDRLNTTFEVWQSTTIGCVQCHSHPYDPFRHQEYYELMAFFNHTQDNDLDTDIPVLEWYPESEEQEIAEIIAYIRETRPSQEIDRDTPAADKIRQAIFPRLIPFHVDDYYNVLIYGDGLLSNWSNNAKSNEGKKFYFKYDDIDLEGLKQITFFYSAGGDDAGAEIRLDEIGGQKIGEVEFAATKGIRSAEWAGKNDFGRVTVPISERSGRHDLVFEIINTTGKMPEGIIMIKDLYLHYEHDKMGPDAWRKHTDPLVAMRGKAILSPIMKDRSPAFRRSTHVFERGNWMVKGEEVKPKIPGALPQIHGAGDPERLALAKWLVSRENPLTARVMVNRFWEQLFGTGIIETVEDFGTQGMPPSHPELLDFLAVRFMADHQWRIKSLLKEIVSSATYRQSSNVSAIKKEKDPDNRYLARAPRYRLSAEQVRDQALFVSGLLNDTVGGKSVMPPQPDGIWQIVYSGEQWQTEEKDRYRRGLYTYWKRTTPYPSMVTFDSPSREFCVSRRIRTNTPLQALVTLNDPVYVEIAEALGKQMIREGGQDVEAAIRAGYKRALAAEPEPEFVEVLMDLYQQASMSKEATGARPVAVADNELKTHKELDPMTVVANAIMNLDAFLVKN